MNDQDVFEETLSDDPFIITKEHRRFVEFCDACHRYRYIGLCYGAPGVGKTMSARHYSHERITTLTPEPDSADGRTILYTPPVSNSPRQIAHDITRLRTRLGNRTNSRVQRGSDQWYWGSQDCTELVLVDEADRLKMPGLEQVRDIYDRSKVGVVLIGMPGMEKRLSRYPQLYSRVGFVHQFRPLSAEEVRFILEQKWQEFGYTLQLDDFTDMEAVAAIVRITQGNFRLLHRLFTQIERIVTINQVRGVSKEVIETARESLVIGAE
jgi:hypothetical protein